MGGLGVIVELGVEFTFERLFSGKEGGSTGGHGVGWGFVKLRACDLLPSASLASFSSSLDYVLFITLVFSH